MTEQNKNLESAPEIGAPTAAKELRDYSRYGQLWPGVPRPFFAPEVELLAQHAGLLPILDQVRSVDAVIRKADVEEYMAVHGIDAPVIPDLLPAPSEAEAAWYVDAMLAHGAHLMPLVPLDKAPVEEGWDAAPAMSREAAIAHLVAGGNLGWNLGPSEKILIDCEDARSTASMIAAGYVPGVVTANGQDPTSPKFNGRHFEFDVPEGLDPQLLRSKLGVALGGGKCDILAAPKVDEGEVHPIVGGTQTVTVKRRARFAVAPGSQLFGARAGRYGPTQEFADGATNGPAPLWLWGLGEEQAPEPVAELQGAARSREKRPYEPNPNSDRVTQAVDAIAWDAWLAHDVDGKLQYHADDGGCGCEVYAYSRATSGPRSVILHDGCEHGYGAHAFSGTLQAEWGREHGSRLQLAAFLADKSERELAREHGIDLGRAPLSGYTLEDLKVANSTSALSTESADGAAAVAEAEAAVASNGAWLQREIARIEAETRCWESVKFLRDIDSAAASRGLLNWGLYGATAPRVALHIPPHVRLVGSDGQEGGPNSGSAVSLYDVLLGGPEAGKSETMKVSSDLVPLPEGSEVTAAGTGEGIMKTFGSMIDASGHTVELDDNDDVDPGTTSEDDLDRFAAKHSGFIWRWNTQRVLLWTAESETFMTEMQRQGTKAMAIYRGGWMGEEIGTTASDVKRRTFMSPHSYRLCCALGAQLDAAALAPVLAGARLGNPQRFGFFPVGVTEVTGSPVLRLPIPDVRYEASPAAVAAYQLVEGQRPAVWIHWPPAARAEFEAARRKRRGNIFAAWDTQGILAQAEADDPMAEMGGHELLHQLKIAAVMARYEGLIDPTDEHWFAAGAVMQVRAAVLRATVEVLAACEKVQRIRTGRDKGEVSGHSRIAEHATQDQYRLDIAAKAVAAVKAAGEPISESAIGGRWRPTARGFSATCCAGQRSRRWALCGSRAATVRGSPSTRCRCQWIPLRRPRSARSAPRRRPHSGTAPLLPAAGLFRVQGTACG
ncbi:Bifunctional DNA primase [Rhodococcus erythropolis]|uniref:Bifunctional DNA primase n=1 Tax=Rhodococcus erythropolis TaxID=1833 RepID=A0A6G9CMT1_RHOER|nr:bifunctional DNA primase/polymerase [Rhodococcus erythropolis]QIP38006.1 Bifunctional DNA primase [Rhodococcus erythropolis]